MIVTTITDVNSELAESALNIQNQINKLNKELDAKKEELRTIANGNKMEIIVPEIGKVTVSSPRDGSERTVMVFNEERLKESPVLRKKLLDKNIIKEEIKKVSPAKASVSIKPNV